MSMLTPPGMGGRYRVTGNRYPRMRRPRRRGRIVVATTAAVTAVGVLSWGTVQLVDVFTDGRRTVRTAAAGQGCVPGGTASPTAGSTGTAGAAGTAGTAGTAGKTQNAKGAEGTARPAPTPTRTGAPPRPAAVTVNVYNATTRAGLAKKTADELRKRGFKIGEVANAPASLDKKVKETGLLMGPPEAYRSGAFDVLLTQLPDAVVRPVGREGGEVDLVLGDAFRALAAEAAARKALTALASPSPSPSPSC
ncbi:LytR C-terminal domain-containing protein [Streptomyces sp. TRM 70361]|uniref:LytR C-terminal domain-containing protein n=1 Tax=Streptomyces sp. TRM 70361 TaxID=3116553 RepID=UPI002E7AB201|nr:LytR C-terminal domain-containing protein [Streptomyces sp. TRM 70361]MEE1939681.1 LytR C-terminal domain-containing protein [Streptomyces sp. TRM 70361]